MKQLHIRITYALLIAVIAIGSLAFGDPVRQDTVTRYYSIPNFSFVPPNDAVGYARNRGGLSGVANDPFYASINLPDSARVVEMRAYIIDDTTGPNLEVELWRVPNTVFTANLMAHVESSTPSPDIQVLIDSTIDYDLIDNTTYFYHAEVRLSQTAGLGMRGMLITYTVVEGTQVEETIEFDNASYISPTAYPTPFSGETNINYTVPKREKVSIKIYDQAGRLARTILDGVMPIGSYTARWDCRDEKGKRLPSGAYFCVVNTNGSSTTKVVHIQ
jgi:hypothetical protein